MVHPSTESKGNNSDLTKIEMTKFVEKFRQRRIEMGLQQAEVGRALRRIYGNGLLQATVCRFEAMKHTLPSMNKLKRILEDWLKRTEAGQSEDASSQSSLNRSNMENVDPAVNVIQINPRKRRTPITGPIRKFLESEFRKQNSFNSEEIKRIADAVKLEASVVKVWFHNCRQREKPTILGSVSEQSAASNI